MGGGSLWGLGGGFAEAEAGFDATPSFDSDDEQSAVLRCFGKSEVYEPYHAFGRHWDGQHHLCEWDDVAHDGYTQNDDACVKG